ncbi:MAG: SRPBCC domain-containing protein [Planctomycetota bacterium]
MTNHDAGLLSRFLRSPLTLCASLCFSLGGCSSVDPAGSEANPLASAPVAADQINWPRQYNPDDAAFFVHNQIFIAASPEVVWGVLMEADSWPSWYAGAEDVQVQSAADGRLYAHASFKWRTMGLRFTSVVKEFEPPYRLSWESRRSAIQGYHAWLLIPTEGGTRLVTDESQHGFLATMQRLFLRNKLYDLHETWLEAIKARAEER